MTGSVKGSATTGLRMATVPDDHPYIAAILPSDMHRVRFPGGQWDPSPLLTASRPVLSELDVVHVHFGYESLTTTAMQHWIAEVRAAETALVVTVHDLRNPHQHDSTQHDAHLSALITAADEVITLTEGAAAEIALRWHRKAQILAHPSLLDPSLLDPSPLDPAPAPAALATVGIHLKSLRANVVEPHRLVRAVATGARAAGAAVRVDLHPGVSVPETTVAVSVHPRFTDAELLDYLQGLSVSVLPYQFGSHSGWLELCRDLGVAVVVPDCGFYSEQWPQAETYRNNEQTGVDEASLAAAVERAVNRGRPVPACRVDRDRQRTDIRAAHATIYRRAASAVASSL